MLLDMALLRVHTSNSLELGIQASTSKALPKQPPSEEGVSSRDMQMEVLLETTWELSSERCGCSSYSAKSRDPVLMILSPRYDLSRMTHRKNKQIETISSELDVLKRNISNINNLHNTVLNSSVNEQRQEQAQAELTQLTTDTSRLTNNLKIRIKNLSEQNDKIPSVPGNESDKNTRRMQVAAQKKK